jgi:CubicO group peptidase (beta-lactamase class C family)
MHRAWPLLLANVLAVGQLAAAQAGLDVAAVDAFVAAQMRAQGVPGLGLAVVRAGQVVYAQGYGRTGDGASVTPRTRFLVASLSKSFTGLAVLQLAQQGRLDLDAPVRRYLPGFTVADPEVAGRITVRQLLNHRSGLGDAGFRDQRTGFPRSLEGRVAAMARARPVAEPGTEFHYFNANYEVLARLVEVVSGEPFSDYLRAHVFEPLGMEDTESITSSDDLRRGVPGLARGHLLAYGFPVASGEETGFLAGHAGVVTTAADMGRYLAMLAGRGRLDGEQVVPEEALAPVLSPTEGADYAMGWFVGERGGEAMLYHNGILSTFSGDAVLFPERGDGVVLLYDVHSVAQDVAGFPRLKGGVVALLLGEEPSSGGFGVRHWSLVFGALTLLAVALGVLGLVRLPAWERWAGTVPGWRGFVGAVRRLMPLAVFLAMPAIGVATTGRYFGLLTLYRSAIGVMTWLGVAGLLGAVNALVRLGWLLRRG